MCPQHKKHGGVSRFVSMWDSKPNLVGPEVGYDEIFNETLMALHKVRSNKSKLSL